MYAYHRCRCAPCSAASTAYYEATAHLTRQHAWSAAEPARQRLAVLCDSGLSVPAIAALCGVSVSQVRNLIRGPHGRTVQRVRQSTMDSLNAISYRDTTRIPSGTYVDGARCRRQLQSLSAAGWSVSAMARKTGVSKGTLLSIINGGDTRETTRRRISDAHAALRFVAPPSASQYERTSISTARARAAANGWTVHEDEDFAYQADEHEEAA